jgi:hypothetical protein
MGVEHTAKPAARQRLKAHGNDIRTATLAQRTAKPVRTAKALLCHFRAAHGKDGFAGRFIAEQSLPCKPARQRFCRAYFGLCRAFLLHGKAQFSRSSCVGPDWLARYMVTSHKRGMLDVFSTRRHTFLLELVMFLA